MFFRSTDDKISKRKRAIAFVAAAMLILVSIFDCFSAAAADGFSGARLTLSSDTIKTNSSVVLSAAAIVDGTAVTSGYEYSFGYNKDGGSSFTVLQSYSSSNSYTFTPSSVINGYTGTVHFCAWVKKSNKFFSNVKALNIIPVDKTALILNGNVQSNGAYVVGDPFTVNVTASGGTSPYKYSYQVSDNKYDKKNQTATSVTINTDNWTADKDYTITATVTDAANQTAEYSTIVRLKAKNVPTPAVSSFSLPATARIGNKVPITANASSGTQPYSYRFTYTSNVGSSGNIGKSSSVTWDTSKLKEGTYTVKAEVTDKNGKKAVQQKTIAILAKGTLYPTITTEPSSHTVTKGKDITLLCDDHSENTDDYPPHPYTYQFEIKTPTEKEWTVVRAYGSSEKATVSTNNLDNGNYDVRVAVKDNDGGEYKKTYNKMFTVEVPKITYEPGWGNKVLFIKDSTTIEAKNVSGGIYNGTYQYKFEYKKYGELSDDEPDKESGQWKTFADFGTSSSAEFRINKNDQSGIYAVRITVRNKNDSSSEVSKTAYNYTVKKKQSHTLADINRLLSEIDQYYDDNITGQTQKEQNLKNWKEKDNPDYKNFPFSYKDYIKAYNAAKQANSNGATNFDTLYENLDNSFTQMKALVKSGKISAVSDFDWSPISLTRLVFQGFSEALNAVSTAFQALAGDKGVQVTFFGYDYEAVADNMVSNVFKTIAYSLIIILVGVNAFESAVRYEMFTMRGGVMLLARLVFAKVWVDLSVVICKAIVGITVGWLGDVLNETKIISATISSNVVVPPSNIPVTGWLVDVWYGIFVALTLIPPVLVVFILIVAVYVKLFIRNFEICVLQCVAPPFFACLSGETSKEYFKKFITTYISVVVEVIFMALVWYLYCSYVKYAFSPHGDAVNFIVSDADEILTVGGTLMTFILTTIGACILMLKPPRILKSLINS